MTTTAAQETKALRKPPKVRGDRGQGGGLGWIMAGPAILLLVGFLVLPFVLAFYFSFTNQRLISPNPTEFVGTANFKRLLTVRILTLEPVTDASGQPVLDEAGQPVYPPIRDYTRNNPEYPQYDGLQEWFDLSIGGRRVVFLAGDAVFMRSLVNNFIFGLIVVPAQAGLGLVLALLVNKRIRGVNIFRTIYFVPVVSSLIVVSLLWRFLYEPEGLVNQMLAFVSFGALGPVEWLSNPSTALLAIMIMSIWQAVGFHMVIWLAGLQTIPGHLYEAAAIDGANSWDQFKHVTWPGLRNTAVFVLITITIAAFGLFVQPAVMTEGGPLDATTTVVFQAIRNGFYEQDIAYGSAISVVFFVIVLLVALVQRWLTREAE